MIVALVGATGTGKSALSLALVERWASRGLAAEIVNADAMQLYRGMDIGTAKLPVAERGGVPHHLIDVLDVTEEASAARYQIEARDVIESIQSRGAVPIVVGGSGLYVAALLTDFRFPGTDALLRAQWEHELERRGSDALHRELAQRDPRAAEAIDPRNGRRVVRALEVIDLTGEPFSAGLAARDTPWRPYRQIGLRMPREQLVPRLDARVEAMWAAGMLAEVEALRAHGLEQGVTARRAIGYAQALAQLAGEATEAEAIAETAALTRRYARRQVGWFGRDAATEWVDALDDDLLARVDDLLAVDQQPGARP
ncbi:tRNA (adenosine(37)-N6)-dimethylallyltransferase MiaA [Microcella daejeonensis]|uniref:tRNA (adenosine(37)-N6)-dimethylallyltransferase MiaA n=1 Tax=Microcella daejeonensis TaxID=2994971 RepID=UPI00226D5068|nr:tRNA (adenosine(37)-N6)-dimethylallyltransferase MiaA [Microcella daejeonensis]WAB83667.1 tRNA (adenosine(37)-N6)-dimethylallyltransferase MiaA [Microcella daejeonensis]